METAHGIEIRGEALIDFFTRKDVGKSCVWEDMRRVP